MINAIVALKNKTIAYLDQLQQCLDSSYTQLEKK